MNPQHNSLELSFYAKNCAAYAFGTSFPGKLLATAATLHAMMGVDILCDASSDTDACLLLGSHLACANGPHWLIGHHNVRPVLHLVGHRLHLQKSMSFRSL